MNELNSMAFLGYPVGLLVLTIVITVIASAIASSIAAVLAVRVMASRLLAPAALQAGAGPPSPIATAASAACPALIAAISAAVYSTVGAQRIVYVGAQPGTNWTTELRSQHHTSHAVPRVHHSND